MFDIEKATWTEIETEIVSLSSVPLQEILSNTIIWLETNRFKDSSQQQINHLSSVYSFFIELLMSQFPNKHLEIKDGADFSKHFLEIFKLNFQGKKETKDNEVHQVLYKIGNWINFNSTVISSYSFDLTIEPLQENELIFFNSSPEVHYNWLVNGLRYEMNQLNYNFKGSELIEYVEKHKNLKFPGKTESDVELNKKLEAIKQATLLLLNDLVCESFKVGNKYIEPAELLNPIISYSFNRLNRYEERLQEHIKSSKSWNEAFMKLLVDSMKTNILREPYFLMTEEEYDELNKLVISNIKEDTTKNCLT